MSADVIDIDSVRKGTKEDGPEDTAFTLGCRQYKYSIHGKRFASRIEIWQYMKPILVSHFSGQECDPEDEAIFFEMLSGIVDYYLGDLVRAGHTLKFIQHGAQQNFDWNADDALYVIAHNEETDICYPFAIVDMVDNLPPGYRLEYKGELVPIFA